MSFHSKEEFTPPENQLSLLDFKDAETAEAADSSMDYHAWAMAYHEPQKSGSGRFLTFSASVHIAAAVLIALLAVPVVENTKTETISIELEDSEPTPKMATTLGAPVLATQGGPEVVAQEDITAPTELAATLPAKVAEPKPVKAAKVAAKFEPTKAASPTVAKTDFQAVPASIDDLDAPALDEGAFAAAPVKSELSEDFSDDLDQVDVAHQKNLQEEKNKLDAMAVAVHDQQEEELSALDADTKAEAQEIAEAAQALKNKNAQAVASALAAENAEKAARAQQARTKAAAAASALANGKGQGAGNNGEQNVASNQLAGAPQGVRSLDQLKQMPGNPRPQYDRDERLKGHAGEVVFLAYISKAGSVTQFRLMKSTGYKNLDKKTLATLRKWRFNPGQEGWVELPFKWDLQGGPQQDGGMLRAASYGY